VDVKEASTMLDLFLHFASLCHAHTITLNTIHGMQGRIFGAQKGLKNGPGCYNL
jgi:hypothetical protein